MAELFPGLHLPLAGRRRVLRFSMAITAAGPPMWWSYLLVGAGQMLVCLVFGELVSKFPISGGLYPWARRLVGNNHDHQFRRLWNLYRIPVNRARCADCPA
jgi:Amino acid permease